MAVRYRCTACGNLTRFDVTTTSTTRSFHHYTVGGELNIESVEVLASDTTDVHCHWCNAGLGPVVQEGAVQEGAVQEGAVPVDADGHGAANEAQPDVPMSEPAG